MIDHAQKYCIYHLLKKKGCSLKLACFSTYEPVRRESFYLSFGSINDILHVDGVFALVFALLLVFLLEYPFFADAEAAR